MALYHRCRTIFLRCKQFESDAALRSVFITDELVVYQKGLPEGNSVEERVDLLLSYIFQEKFTDGRPAIVAFIAALRDRYQADHPLAKELEDLQLSFETQRLQVTDIPVIVVAMTDEEVDELVSENFYKSSNSNGKGKFEEFQTLLTNHLTNWESHYKTFREDWLPFYGEEIYVKQIVWHIATKVNERRMEMSLGPILRPIFLSENFFSTKRTTRSQTWDYLSINGGILIVDAVSLIHPKLRSLLQRSHVSTDPKVGMILLYPSNPNALPINRILEEDIRDHMEREFRRFSEHFDRWCEIGVNNNYSLQRSLYSMLFETAEIAKQRRPKAANLERIRTLMGEPTGMDKLVFGKEGVR